MNMFLKPLKSRILAFHSISDKSGFSITRNSTGGFRKILEYLKSSGLGGVSLSGRLAGGDVALTFDDGWSDFYANAFPILREYGFSATVFVITGYAGRSSGWDYRRRPHLSWSQITELANSGIEFGSHGANHVDLRGLSDRTLEHEVAGSKKALEDELGRAVNYFAYPFGRFDRRAVEAVRKAGYAESFGLACGEDDYVTGRYGVYLYDTPYSINRKLVKHSRLELGKDYINNRLAGGTIILRKLFPAGGRE